MLKQEFFHFRRAAVAKGQRRHHEETRVPRMGLQGIEDIPDLMAFHFFTGDRRVGLADAGKKYFEVVVNLGDGPDGRTRIARNHLLLNGDGGG